MAKDKEVKPEPVKCPVCGNKIRAGWNGVCAICGTKVE